MLDSLLILVVEDEPAVANACAGALERAGATVSVARTAAEAVAVARVFPLSAVVADANLPFGECGALWYALRDGSAMTRAPFVVISGDAESRGESRADGM